MTINKLLFVIFFIIINIFCLKCDNFKYKFKKFMKKDLDDTFIVSTKQGLVKGEEERILDCKSRVFRGIPFASPPVGRLSFRKTQPLHWYHRSILDATQFGPACMQGLERNVVDKSEDCLQINIWTPMPNKANNSNNHSDSLLPVLLFVHGSAFLFGSATFHKYSGAYFSCFGNVVFVSFNYRLGILGFFNGNRDDVPGNQGIYDLKEALYWIQDNIESFGGDKNRITVYGLSSGASMISLLLPDINEERSKTKDNRPLFTQVILSSGSPDLLMQSSEEAFNQAKKAVFLAGCKDFSKKTDMANPKQRENNKLTTSELNCLKKKNSNLLIYIQENVMKKSILSSPFVPNYGSELLPKKFKFYLMNKLIKKDIRILIGSVKYEIYPTDIFLIAMNATSKYDFIDYLRNIYYNKNINGYLDEFIDIYFDNIDDKDINKSLEMSIKLIVDLDWQCLFKTTASYYSQINPTYYYLFTHGKNFGPVHAEDIFYIFADPFINPDRYNDIDKQVSKEIIKIWSDFVHGKEMWKPVNSNSFYLYEINPKVKDKVYKDASYDICKLWAKYMDYE